MNNARYTIGVVARLLNLTPQTIREYESRGFVRPTRTTGNTRLFSDSDVDTLRMISKLTQEMKVNLSGVEIIIKLVQQIQKLEIEKEQLYQMLFEAGEMLQNYIDTSNNSTVPMRSSVGTLIQIISKEMG